MNENLTGKIRSAIPKKVRLFLFRQTRFPGIGKVKSYNFFSLKPISNNWGSDRGSPIDRYYIEKFLLENSDVIKGRVLEIAENLYTLKFGGDKVTKSEVLHADADNPAAAYVGDLADIPHIPSDTFDCIILTQTLQVIADLNSAVNTLFRILKKDGAVLVTVPGISQMYIDEKKRWKDYWRFTENSLHWLFSHKFEPAKVSVKSYGNVLSSIAFLHGLAKEELSARQLDYQDENYQMLIGLKAVK